MPKRFLQSKKFNPTKPNKKRKIQNDSKASFPQSSKSLKYMVELSEKNAQKTKIKNKKWHKKNANKQRNEHETFVKRQDNVKLSVHDRINELMKKGKSKRKFKGKKSKNKRKKKQIISLAELRKNNNNNNNSNSNGSQFRWMNQMLYNITGYQAKDEMRNYENEFKEYHQTYNDIVENEWPENPLQTIIKSISKKLNKICKIQITKDKDYGPPDLKQSKIINIADFGCGDAKIARYFDKNRNNLNYKIKVHSFDLIALNKYVTSCNISNVPLQDESMDIGIFCLSLMGTNFHEYLTECHRVLKQNGILKIAEVRSRFYGINKFERFLNRCGFDVVAKDLDNSHFALFHCRKSDKLQCQSFPNNFDAKTVLKPCLYKKR